MLTIKWKGEREMKTIVTLVLTGLLLLSLVGCGKTEQESDKMPVDVKEAEQMDTTRLDSAMHDSTMMPVDTASDMMEDSLEHSEATGASGH